MQRTSSSFGRGRTLSAVGLVLSRDAYMMIEEDFWGNRNILADVLAGGSLRGGLCVFAGGAAPRQRNCRRNRAANACWYGKPPHARNLFERLPVSYAARAKCSRGESARKEPRAHAKTLAYEQAQHAGEAALVSLRPVAGRRAATTFEIPFNRQQLADYLCVDRSAMSNELCKMRDEGLLDL